MFQDLKNKEVIKMGGPGSGRRPSTGRNKSRSKKVSPLKGRVFFPKKYGYQHKMKKV